MGAVVKTLYFVFWCAVVIWGLWLWTAGAHAAERSGFLPLTDALSQIEAPAQSIPDAVPPYAPLVLERQNRKAPTRERADFAPLSGFNVRLPPIVQQSGIGSDKTQQKSAMPPLPFRWDPAQAPPKAILSTRAAPDISTPKKPRAGAALSGVHGLRDLIGWVEAGRANYDAVVLSARIKPERLPTQMTLHEIFLWIERTPGQNHAIGRYQFIPNTLDRLVRKLDISRAQTFSPDLQDRLANALLVEAGLTEFILGELTRKGFMDNLAEIWAGLPNSSGRSHYHGFAGNKAVISWRRFAQAMDVFFPL